MVVTSAVKLVKGWNALTVGADYLGIHDRGHIESRRFLHDKRIAIAPIVSIDRVKPHPTIADMDLQSIAVVLQFVRPTRPGRRLRRKSSGRFVCGSKKTGCHRE
jgi:hypothetical protein